MYLFAMSNDGPPMMVLIIDTHIYYMDVAMHYRLDSLTTKMGV